VQLAVQVRGPRLEEVGVADSQVAECDGDVGADSGLGLMLRGDAGEVQRRYGGD
jgi:hypothetical protein